MQRGFCRPKAGVIAELATATDFGVEVFFNLKNKQLLHLDPKDWKDIEKVCL